jgi:dinuclear metal center YbgI/SA1388 family protein
MVESRILIGYLNSLLKLAEIEDASQNGLQIQCPEQVQKVGFAVDAALATFEAATRENVQLLIVHHGLYWRDVQLATDAHYRRLKLMFDAGIGLYAVHLPLDAHEELGNNRGIVNLLGLADGGPFGDYKGVIIGRLATAKRKLYRDELREMLDEKLETSTLMLPFGPEEVKKVGIVSGGGADLLPQAIAEGCDTFITGEQVHSAYHVAREGDINVFMSGHYATETVGLKAVRERLTIEFGVDTVFLDMPTGL